MSTYSRKNGESFDHMDRKKQSRMDTSRYYNTTIKQTALRFYKKVNDLGSSNTLHTSSRDKKKNEFAASTG